jgi:hypothetical protein
MKVEEMFYSWAESGSFEQAAALSNTDPRTVRRYHDKYGWPARLERIHSRMMDEVDADIVEVKSEMLRELAVIRKRAVFSFLRVHDLKAKDAANIHDRALKSELLVRGEATSRAETIIGRAAERHAERGSAGEDKPAEIPAGYEVKLEVVAGGGEPEDEQAAGCTSAGTAGAQGKGGGS